MTDLENRRTHTATRMILRLVRAVGGGAALVALGVAVGVVPLPVYGVEPLAVEVDPAPADLLELCTGSLLRLGDETGGNADQVFSVGEADVVVSATIEGATLSALGEDEGGESGTSAPRLLGLAAAPDALLGGAQAQEANGQDQLQGLAASSCVEPSSSSWLVGGAMTVGRTTLLLLANPTSVVAEVTVQMWGESGAVSAPGMTGIRVLPGTQRVLSLAGFAPGLVSPVLHVEARGGQVVAALQTSSIRVLDPGGVDLFTAGAAPAKETVIPAVRIFDGEAARSATGLDGHDDLAAIVRVGNPGERDADVTVSVLSTKEGSSVTSFDLHVPAGTVAEAPLDAGLALGEDPLPDGSYSVRLVSETPVVAGIRTSTASSVSVSRSGDVSVGDIDLAWFASAEVLSSDAVLAVADAAKPVLAAYASGSEEVTLLLQKLDDGQTVELRIPAGQSRSVPLNPGSGYLVKATESSLWVGVSFAATGQLAGYTLTAPSAADGALLVRP